MSIWTTLTPGHQTTKLLRLFFLFFTKAGKDFALFCVNTSPEKCCMDLRGGVLTTGQIGGEGDNATDDCGDR